jgi:alpha-L-arabinofuranosidase
VKGNGTLTVLQSDNLDAVNSLEVPAAVSPAQQKLAVNGNNISLTLKPYSLNVIRVKIAE